VLNLKENHVRIEGLQLHSAATENGSNILYIEPDSDNDYRISYCIVRGTPGSGDTNRGIYIGGDSTSARNIKCWNTLIYDCGYKGIIDNGHPHNSYWYNITVKDCDSRGFNVWATDGSVIVKNCLSDGNGDYDFRVNASYTTLYNCASSDGTADDYGGSGNRINQTFTFIDEANDNFHLAPNDTCARNYGTDLSSDPNLAFNDDIDGETRTGTWDIGADEEVPVEFVSTIMESGGDYDSLSSWESAINCDLTSTSTRVYSFSDHSGTIPDGAAVSTDGGASTAILLHQSNLNNQVLLVNIQGSFDAGDVVTDGTNTVTLSDNGASVIAVAKIDGTWTSPDTTAVTIDGWTTDADHYIRIYTTETARHNGKWNTSKYRLVNNADSYALDVNEPYTKIEGLQIRQTGSGVYNHALDVRDAPHYEVSYNIIWGCNGNNAMGIIGHAPEGPVKVWNNIVFDFNSSRGISISIDTAGQKAYVYNNTVYNCNVGIYSAGYQDIVAKNNLVQDCTDGYGGSFDPDSDYNISDISGDAPGSNSKTCTVSFIDEANDDFHLASNDTCAKDSGTDLSSDPNLAFNDDIDGETRTGTWDIGADEYVAAAAESEKSTQINTPITNKFTSGLVGYWTFNGADIDWSTNTAYDRSGQDNNGTIYGAKPAIGKVGQALEFDGVNDYVDCGNGPSLDITDAITVEAWAKSDAEENGRIVSKHGGGSYGWMLSQRGSDDSIEWRISTTGSDWNGGFTSPNSFKINTWHHIAATYDGSYMRVYIDGVEDTGGDFPVDLTGSINVAPASTQIGRCERGGAIFSNQKRKDDY